MLYKRKFVSVDRLWGEFEKCIEAGNIPNSQYRFKTRLGFEGMLRRMVKGGMILDFRFIIQDDYVMYSLDLYHRGR